MYGRQDLLSFGVGFFQLPRSIEVQRSIQLACLELSCYKNMAHSNKIFFAQVYEKNEAVLRSLVFY